MTANGVGTCGADDNQAQAGHLVVGVLGEHAPAMGAGNKQGCATIGVAYPLAVRGRDGGADLEAGAPGDPMFALRAGDGGSSRSQLVAVHENQRGEVTTQDNTALNTGGGKPGQGYPAITDGMIVRRLTPLECERLQGFPDNWTLTDGASDSQRYRQMGNSVAVPVFEWVLSRLADASEAVACDVVYDPFGGIMTVPYCAVKAGRVGWGVELNPLYFRDGVAHVETIAAAVNAPTLFDLAAEDGAA